MIFVDFSNILSNNKIVKIQQKQFLEEQKGIALKFELII